MQKHLKQIGIPSLIALIFIVVDMFIKEYTLMHYTKWVILAFFIGSSLLTTFITSYGMKANPDGFNKYYFTSTGVRFFLSIIFVIICIFLRIEGRTLFVINFFVFYFLYFVFEIYFLLGNLRAKSETSE